MDLFGGPTPAAPAALTEATVAAADAGTAYVEAVRGLSEEAVAAGIGWLREVIAQRWAAVGELLPAVARVGTRGLG